MRTTTDDRKPLIGLLWLSLSLTAFVACDDDPEPTDGGNGEDAGEEADAGTDDRIALEGLDGPVEVIIDDRGMPHIYASTRRDLFTVQGYMMARDRFTQMEFIRRGVLGTLGEVLGGLDPSVLDDDQASRFLGFGRVSVEIYNSLPADDPTRQMAEWFVAGINQWIDQFAADREWEPPRGLSLFNIVRSSDNFGHWAASDVFALARFQAWNLSYHAEADIGRTQTLAAIRAAFGEPDDPRRGLYGDFNSEVQARRVYTRDGFPDGSTSAALPRPVPRIRPPRTSRFGPIELPSDAQLAAGLSFHDNMRRFPWAFGDEHIGSNSWVVSGSNTESGDAILSNDPHLSLTSPGVWWYVHLNTAAMDGEDAIDAQGIAFAGLPGVVLGYNNDIAWSATTTSYDVTDVYLEEVNFNNTGTEAEPVWVPVSVNFDPGDGEVAVNFETVVEEIGNSGGDSIQLPLLIVPHHGPIIPTTIEEPESTDNPVGSALSVRYTGFDVSNELAFFDGLLTATSVDDALTALDNFQVGSQNFSFATRSGDIAWSTRARIPQRSTAACSFTYNDDGTIPVDVASPLFILPGTGMFEWQEPLADEFIPHDINPTRGYIATANQDNVGVTDDGNPCNDAYYIGGDFAVGYRQGRIVERLDALIEAGPVDTEDMIALQHETQSQLGDTLRDPFVAILDHALGDPSDDPVLEAVVDGLDESGRTALQNARDRLAAWTRQTPHGVGATDTDEIADSVATTIFNIAVIHTNQLAFGDEVEAIGGRRPGSSQTARLLEWAVTDPDSLYTYDDTITDTVLWDDLSTESVTETRDERVVSAFIAAIDWLTDELGDDWDQWRWGRLHAVHFNQIVPPLGPIREVNVPPSNSTEFPTGFPRDGDYGAVDVNNFSMWDPDAILRPASRTYSGPSQRLVVEMTDDGPRAFNALPGGQAEDPDSPHHADEAAIWNTEERPPLYFTRSDVEANAELELNFVPAED